MQEPSSWVISTPEMRKKTLFPHLPTTKHAYFRASFRSEFALNRFASCWIVSQVSHCFVESQLVFPPSLWQFDACVYYVFRKPRTTSPTHRLPDFDVLLNLTSLRCSSLLCPLWCCLARKEGDVHLPSEIKVKFAGSTHVCLGCLLKQTINDSNYLTNYVYYL